MRGDLIYGTIAWFLGAYGRSLKSFNQVGATSHDLSAFKPGCPKTSEIFFFADGPADAGAPVLISGFFVQFAQFNHVRDDEPSTRFQDAEGLTENGGLVRREVDHAVADDGVHGRRLHRGKSNLRAGRFSGTSKRRAPGIDLHQSRTPRRLQIRGIRTREFFESGGAVWWRESRDSPNHAAHRNLILYVSNDGLFTGCLS